MDISLNNEQEKFVRESISSGRYGSSEEVVQEALSLLQLRDGQTEQEWWADVRAKVAVGLEQLDRGEVVSGEVVFEELKQLSREMREKRDVKKPAA